jgi:hypothetical protein
MEAILIKQFGGLGGLVTGSCPIQFRSPDLFLGIPDRLEHPHAIWATSNSGFTPQLSES